MIQNYYETGSKLSMGTLILTCAALLTGLVLFLAGVGLLMLWLVTKL